MELSVEIGNTKEHTEATVPEQADREMTALEKLERVERVADEQLRSALFDLSRFCENTARQMSVAMGMECRQTQKRYARRLKDATGAITAAMDAAW